MESGTLASQVASPIEDHLSKHPLFRNMAPADLKTLANSTRQRVFAPGTPIVARGDPGGSIYFVLSGRVKIHTASVSGDEVILAVLGPGEFFGDMSVIDGAPRSADVTAHERSACLILERDALREAVRLVPSVAWSLLGSLSQRLREQNAHIESLATRDVTARVAERLLKLARHHGKPWRTGGPLHATSAAEALEQNLPVLLDVNFTQTDIAAFVGATRERVNQTMRSLKKSGMIATDSDSGHIVVCKPRELEKRVERG